MAKRPKRVLIDFDGVVVERGRGKRGRPIDGAVGSIRGLKDLGYEVVIFTTRASSEGSGAQMVEDWCQKHGIVHDGITGEKLDAQYYIDDKAVNFRGDWREVMEQIT